MEVAIRLTVGQFDRPAVDMAHGVARQLFTWARRRPSSTWAVGQELGGKPKLWPTPLY